MADGFVTLVGAGPGDPGLLTIAAKQAIADAQVVLYDRLVSQEILALARRHAPCIDVGKNMGNHTLPQDQINRHLLEYAQAGKRVVRLKGGDPFLFGRGAEELELLRDHGIPFRVIPGITSALAVPAYAGIPVTHREYASSVHILTGHGKNGQSPDVNYPELAKLNGTLVFLMGLSALEEICSKLAAAGKSPETPAAVIGNGTQPQQKRIVATLTTLPGMVRQADAFPSPAVIVVGAVCALADRFDWTHNLPLFGKRILTVCSHTTGSRLADRLRKLGCGVDEFAGIAIEPVARDESFWNSLDRYSWTVFTSQFGAQFFFKGLADHAIDVRRLTTMKFAAIGNRTAEVLAERGIFTDFIPDAFNARNLAHGLAERVGKDGRLLLFRAREGNPELADILSSKGIPFDEVPAYDTFPQRMNHPEIVETLTAGKYDAVAFTSASSVKAFAAEMQRFIACPPLPAVCIGESTAATAARFNMKTTVASEASIDSMVDRILIDLGK